MTPFSNDRFSNINVVPLVLWQELAEALKDLQEVHMHCQSLPSHIEEIHDFFWRRETILYFLSATWLTPTLASELFALEGYNILRKIGR